MIASFLDKLPPDQMTEVRRQGLIKFRAGVKQMEMNAVGLLTNPNVREDNRPLTLNSAERNLPALSEAPSPDERAQVKREVEKLGADAPQGCQPTPCCKASFLRASRPLRVARPAGRCFH